MPSMSALSTEPVIIQAGDTIAWRKHLPNYPASAGWSLTYTFVGQTGKFQIAATPDGSDYAVTVPATTSATWQPGKYRWVATVTRAGERYTVDSGLAVVKPDLTAAPVGTDPRTPAQRTLDDLKAALQKWLSTSGHVREYEINGRRMVFASAADIEARIKIAQRMVAEEQAAERLAAGLNTRRRIMVRF